MTSTFASPAIYTDGIVIPEVKPAAQPQQVVVIYIGMNEDKKKDTVADFIEAFKATKGILSHDEIDGVVHENQIRQEAEKHWQALQLDK